MPKAWHEMVEYLDAFPYRTGWLYYAHEVDETWFVDAQDLEHLARYLEEDEVNGYSLWCSAGYGKLHKRGFIR